MDLELGAIVAIALSTTATLSDFLHIPQKLRAWTALLLIVLFNIGNQWLFHETFLWRDALLVGLYAGLAAVGIYSTTKNTREQYTLVNQQKTEQPEPEPASESEPPAFTYKDNPYV